MGDEKDEKGAAVKAAVELAKQAYVDGAQPLVQNVGQLAALPFRLLNAAFANVRALLTDHEAQQRALERGMAERWARIPPSRLLPPPSNVAGPWFLGYSFVQDEQDAPLRELYEELLATAMDSDRQETVHPSFVEMLRQMTAVEARLLKHLSSLDDWRAPLIDIKSVADTYPTRTRDIGIGHPFLPEVAGPLYQSLENLERLKLLSVSFQHSIPDIDAEYARLRAEADALYSKGLPPGELLLLTDGLVKPTQLGQRFVRACIPQPSTAPADGANASVGPGHNES